MNRLKKWLVDRYLPAYAREVQLEENERLRKELDATAVNCGRCSTTPPGWNTRCGICPRIRYITTMNTTSKCAHCPWRGPEPYCLWPRCWRWLQANMKKPGKEEIAHGSDAARAEQPRV